MDSDYKKMLHDMAWYSLNGCNLLIKANLIPIEKYNS